MEQLTALSGAMSESSVDELLSSLGEWNVIDESYGKNLSGNESYDVRFTSDIRNNNNSPCMGFGNTAGEAKRDLLRQLIIDGKIKLGSVRFD